MDRYSHTMEPPSAQRWLRVQQAADLLGVSATTVRRWADDGRLLGQRTPSGQRRFRLDDLTAVVTPAAQHGPSADVAEPGCRGDRPQRSSDAERRYQRLLETSLELASTLDIGEVLQSAARRLGAALEVPDCDVYRLEDDRRLVCVAAHQEDSQDAWWVGEEFPLDDYPCSILAVETQHAVAVSSLDDPRLGPAERAEMRRYGQRSCVVLPLLAHERVVGLVDLFAHEERKYTGEEIAAAEVGAQLVALALDHAQLYEEVKRLHLGNLRALSSALSAKDYYTLGHAGRVAAYAALLGRELGWPDARLELLQNVAFLHDIGKIGVSDRVLLKGGPLTSEEWELVRQHPGISAEIVRPLFDDALVAGVRYHHERFDGSGYPDGLSGKQIPVVARALCTVDCYDAMASERPYRRALTYRQSLAELRRCAGTQFDPQMVDAFTRVLRRLKRRRAAVDAIALEAAALVDPVAHAALRSRDDEARPEYREMVAALRALRNAHPDVRFITTFAMAGDLCIAVLDTGETESEISHLGDRWLPHDELAVVLAGEQPEANVLNADDFGVWITGLAAVRDARGKIAAAVTVDVPAIAWAPALQQDQAHTLTAILQAAAMRYSRAEVEAITDGLTGLYNHRYLHERLGEELRRASQRDGKVSLLFLDADRFKAYNDARGHKAGDEALCRIARVTESAGRRVDLAARYGGEEFVLVLIDTDGAGAASVAERIRAEVESVCAATGHPLTVSIGVATYPDDATAKDELLDKADWAMYAAKRAGRNRVLVFSDGLVREETWLSRHGR